MKQFPIQRTHKPLSENFTVPESVYMSAYEVYCHVYSPQPALIEGWCRGGFSVGELVAFLYAKPFPKKEWSKRVDEAFEGQSL